MSEHLNELAEIIRRKVANAPAAKPKLRLVRREDLTDKAPGLDPQSRDCIYRRVRDLSRMYSLGWLVRQETTRVGGIIEMLEDESLLALQQKMERGRECRVEGIAFDDAGLVTASSGGE